MYHIRLLRCSLHLEVVWELTATDQLFYDTVVSLKSPDVIIHVITVGNEENLIRSVQSIF